MKHSSVIGLSTSTLLTAILINACSPKEQIVSNPSSFELLQTRIINPTCATAGCHASNADNSFKQHGLVLEQSVAYNNLVGVMPVNSSSKTDGHLRVKAFKSMESLFYHKLNWDNSHHGGKKYGLPMPLGSTALSVGQIEFVRRWIEAGAPREGEVVDATLLDDKTPSNVPDSVFEPLNTPTQEGADGFQLKVEKFTVSPNFERELFVRRNIGNATEIYINRIKLKSRPNSHHMVLYDFRDRKN